MRISIRLRLAMALLVLVQLSANCPAAVVFGTWDPPRVGADGTLVTSTLTEQIRAAVETVSPGYTWAGAGTLTPVFLSGVDILIIHNAYDGGTPIAPLSALEQTALLDFIQQGNSALVVADGFDPASAQTLVAPFSATMTGTYEPFDTGPITNLGHPIANGPFGQATTYTTAYAGWFTDLGPYAAPLANLAFNGQPTYAAIERDAISPGSGRVILTTDGTSFIDSNDGGPFAFNETLFLNSVQWLLPVPEPSTLVLAGVGLFALVAWAVRRPRNSSTGER